PDFWLATVVITFLAIWVQWIPPVGFAPLWEDPARCLGQLTIPALIIGARLAAVSMRMTRSSLLEVLRQDYIRTARAKGARERAVIVRHALKNAFIPVVTVIGQQFSVLLGGTVIVEVIFLQPGVGSLMLDAVLLRDYTLVQGAVLFFAAVIVMTNLLVDLSYAWLDPRIRYRCSARLAGVARPRGAGTLGGRGATCAQQAARGRERTGHSRAAPGCPPGPAARPARSLRPQPGRPGTPTAY